MEKLELASNEMPATIRPSGTGVVWTTVPLNFRPIPSKTIRNSKASPFRRGRSETSRTPPDPMSAVFAEARRLAWLYRTDFPMVNRGLFLRSFLISASDGSVSVVKQNCTVLDIIVQRSCILGEENRRCIPLDSDPRACRQNTPFCNKQSSCQRIGWEILCVFWFSLDRFSLRGWRDRGDCFFPGSPRRYPITG